MLESTLSARRFIVHLDNFNPALKIPFEGVGPERRADIWSRAGRKVNLLCHVETPIV